MYDPTESTYNGINIKLAHELWMWRGAVLFLLCVMLVLYFIDSKIRNDQRAYDVRERASHWQAIENGIKENHDLLSSQLDNTKEAIAHMQSEKDFQNTAKTMILKNHEAILRVDEHLRQCSGCHSHPPVRNRGIK